MDFVAKNAIQSKLKKFGDNMGVNDLFGENSVFNGGPSASNDVERNNRRNDNSNELSEEEIFPNNVANYFDSKPSNFPQYLNLFYIDRTILSHHAVNPVKWAYRLLLIVEVFLLLNISTRVTTKILVPKSSLLWMIMSIVFGLLVSFVELVGYEICFRGAYRSSKRIRGHYLVFSVVNIALITLYTFVGVGWFNGWSRIPRLEDIPQGYRRNTIVSLTVIEAIGWTFVLFMSMYTAFENYNLYTGNHDGLSNAARYEATIFDGPPVETNRNSDAQSGPASRSNDPRIQQIREKYTGQSS